MAVTEVVARVASLTTTIQADLLSGAIERRDDRIAEVATVDEAAEAAVTGWAKLPWELLRGEGEARLAQEAVTVRCLQRLRRHRARRRRRAGCRRLRRQVVLDTSGWRAPTGSGVDVGTTFTAAAVRRDGRTEVVQLGNRGAAIPSVLLLRDDGELLTGDTARRRAVSEPDRVATEFKRRVGDPIPVLVGGSPFAAETLVARLLKWVVDTVTEREGSPPAGIGVTHPANWGPYKLDLLSNAIRTAASTTSRSSPSRPLRLASTPRRPGFPTVRWSRSTTWAAAPSTPASCASRPTAASSCWANPRASSASVASTSTRRCWATSSAPPTTCSPASTPTTPPPGPPCPACATTARRPRSSSRPTSTPRSRCCCRATTAATCASPARSSRGWSGPCSPTPSGASSGRCARPGHRR